MVASERWTASSPSRGGLAVLQTTSIHSRTTPSPVWAIKCLFKCSETRERCAPRPASCSVSHLRKTSFRLGGFLHGSESIPSFLRWWLCHVTCSQTSPTDGVRDSRYFIPKGQAVPLHSRKSGFKIHEMSRGAKRAQVCRLPTRAPTHRLRSFCQRPTYNDKRSSPVHIVPAVMQTTNVVTRFRGSSHSGSSFNEDYFALRARIKRS